MAVENLGGATGGAPLPPRHRLADYRRWWRQHLKLGFGFIGGR
jgi:hypothetical protein